MGEKVTARRAADLSGLNERTIRRMIQRGDLPAQKIAVNRYLIDTDHLPPRKRSPIREELTVLHQEIDALKRRLNALEKGKTPPDALRAKSDRVEASDAPVAIPTLTRQVLADAGEPSAPPSVPPANDETLPRVVDVSRYLERHGINPYTPRSWPWLKEALPITGSSLLIRAREHIRASGWRAGTLVLHKCTQANCACWWVLDGNDVDATRS